jgi:hypothetical protein
LKSTLQIETSTIKAALKNQEEDLASTLYKTYVLTGNAYYEEAPQVKESVELLLNFIKDVIVSSAREVWYVPYLYYFTTHDKNKAAEGRHELDKIIKNSMKIVLKQQVGEMIMAQRAVVEKYKEHIDTGEDAEKVSEVTYESSSEISSQATDKESDYQSSSTRSHPHSPHHTPLQSTPQSPARSTPNSPKYVVGSDLKLDLNYSPSKAPSIAASSLSSVTSLKAIPKDDDDIHDLFIPRKSNPTSIDIPLIKKKTSKEHLYNNMSWYRGNPKLYQYLMAKKRNKRRDYR